MSPRPKVWTKVFLRSVLAMQILLGCTPPNSDARREGLDEPVQAPAIYQRVHVTDVDPSAENGTDASGPHPVKVCGVLRQHDLQLLNCPPGTTDSDLVDIGKLTKLWTLVLDSTEVTDVGIEQFVELSQLESLAARKTRISDTGLATIARLSRLNALYLGGSEVTNAGLSHLSALTEMRTLDLADLEIDDDGTARLSGLAKLESLSLRGTRVSDVGLESLRNLTTLKYLDLQGTNVTGRGMRVLNVLPQLSAVDLSDSQTEDSNLVHLTGLATLTELRLEGTRVTRDGVRELARSLPDCRIYYGKASASRGVVAITSEDGILEVIDIKDEFNDIAVFPRSADVR